MIDFDFGDIKKDQPLEYKSGNYIYGFTTKEHGDGREEKTIDALVQKLGITVKSIVIPKQTHSTNIQVVEETTDKTVAIEDCDGLITKLPQVLLTVLAADCVPIVFIDKKNGIIGVSHQGWKGSLARMAQKMVDKMVEQGANKTVMECYVGPSILDCCYNVEKERFSKFKDEFFPYYHLFATAKEGKYFLNLNELNVQQLLETGIGITNVTSFAQCTSCTQETFYSYRRDNKEEFGEMIAYCVKK